MTIYGTPGGTPLNTTPFQGTQPGNPVQGTLQLLQPGVGLFPPNSNNASGDTVLAAVSRGAVPVNVQANNFGATSNSGIGTGAAGGRTVLDAMSNAAAGGTGPAFTANGGAANNGPAGGGSATGAAGGMNQTNAPSSGEASILPANAPASVPTISAVPVYRG